MDDPRGAALQISVIMQSWWFLPDRCRQANLKTKTNHFSKAQLTWCCPFPLLLCSVQESRGFAMSKAMTSTFASGTITSLNPKLPCTCCCHLVLVVAAPLETLSTNHGRDLWVCRTSFYLLISSWFCCILFSSCGADAQCAAGSAGSVRVLNSLHAESSGWCLSPRCALVHAAECAGGTARLSRSSLAPQLVGDLQVFCLFAKHQK